jgi:hypothetical protein
MALGIPDELPAWGLAPPVVAADADYGDNAGFRGELSARTGCSVVPVAVPECSGTAMSGSEGSAARYSHLASTSSPSTAPPACPRARAADGAEVAAVA